MRKFQFYFGAVAAVLAATLLVPISAQAEMLQVLTGRGASTVPVWYKKVPGATATVMLLPGGDAVVNFEGDRPHGNNFMVRTFKMFMEQKVNVAVVGTADSEKVGWVEAVSKERASDLAAVAIAVRAKSADSPLWMVATSRGTVAATAAAIRFNDQKIIDGLVLTSAVVSYTKPQSIPFQDVAKVTVPTLIYQNAEDGCTHCKPGDVRSAVAKFKNSPIAAGILVSGGTGPSGDVCGGQHWHGFIGMEERAVADIVGWINQPTATVK